MNLITYLESLPPIKLGRLYDSTWTCQAVLRSLPPLAKHYVMRLLFIDMPVPASVVDSWAAPGANAKHGIALDKLARLQLLQRVASIEVGTGSDALRLNPHFQQQLRGAVTGGMLVTIEETPAAVLAALPSKQQLDAYAQQQWEALLMFVVGSASKPPALPKALGLEPLDLKALLQREGGANGGSLADGLGGFGFVLADSYHQLWALLQRYLVAAEARSGAQLSSVVAFLLQLGFRDARKPWAAGALEPLQRTIAGHLTQLGLLMPLTVARETWLCPTRMALALTGTGAVQQEVSNGFVIVETNYRVYAYTSSPLQLHILRLFVRPEVLLPGLFVGTLTRESVCGALEGGLSADQLVTYLQQHAHAQVAKKMPVMPAVVSDQIRLWQSELNRVRTARAVLYTSFERADYFRASRGYAVQQGTWLWDDEAVGKLAARAEGHEGMKAFIKSVKARDGA